MTLMGRAKASKFCTVGIAILSAKFVFLSCAVAEERIQRDFCSMKLENGSGGRELLKLGPRFTVCSF